MHTTVLTYEETDRLDSLMLEFLQDNHYEGATIGVARDDKLVYAQGYGETQSGTQMKPATLLPISSISKTITAVAILKMVEHGWVRLTDPVFGPQGILKQLSYWSTEPNPGICGITVQHLLHHTAGWSQHRRGVYDPMMNSVYLAQGINVVNISQELNLENPLTHSDIITFMLSQPLDNMPGIKYEYSNFGYCILGRIIEEISGLSYRRFVTDEILTPLGMWHTRIGPHRLAEDHGPDPDPDVSLQFPRVMLQDGYIPLVDDLQNGKLPYDLLDSTLGWFSNVYDLMRFVTGLTSGMIINKTTLKLMASHPAPPVFEHTESWQGLGIHVGNDDTWWQVGDPHDNEIILFHRNQQLPKRGRPTAQVSDAWSWVMIMSNNNRHNLRDIFNRMATSVTSWPDVDHMVDDCTDFVFTSKNTRVLAHPKIPEHHFQTFTQALSRQRCHPVWIDGYTVNDKTFFSIISEQDLPDDEFRIELDATSSDLNTILYENMLNGYYLNYVTSYISQLHNGHVRHAAVFSLHERKTAKYGWQESWRTYIDTQDIFANQQKLTPVIQSIVSHGHRKDVTYMFEHHQHATSKSFTNLTLAELDIQIRSNSVSDYVLSYLDSYTDGRQTYFSAIFTSWKLGKWQIQTSLSRQEFIQTSALYQGLEYRPRMIVGYELEGTPRYAVMWLRH